MSIESTSIENNEIVDKSSHIFPNLRGTKAENVIIAHLNINFLQNKFEPLAKLVRGKVDILIISETKIDDSFHTNQFMIDGYSSPFREDRNSHGGGLLIYIREDIPCKRLKTPNISSDIEGIFIELNLNNNKWLLMGGYNPNNERTTYFFNQISKAIDMYLKDYENIILIGDFNTTIAETTTSDFCQMYNLQNLINEPTCYKNPKNPSSIDMILTNRKHSFENSTTVETGLSDHHKMIITMMKGKFKKKDPKIINFRCYKNFDDNLFRDELINALRNTHDDMNYDYFKSTFVAILNKHAPRKKKFVRGNNAPFMNKTLSQAFMHRSKLKNKYNKFPTKQNKISYSKQRNYCVSLLKKEKRKYYNNLNPKIFKDNKTFWQRVKPLFSDKQKGIQSDIIIVENGVTTSDKTKVAEKLNNFFVEAVDNLGIEPYLIQNNNVSKNTQDIIGKYENHPSIKMIKENIKDDNKFSFQDTTPEDLHFQIQNLDTKKAMVENDIPTKILVQTNDIVSNYISNFFNQSRNKQLYPTTLKIADVTPLHKKEEKTLTKNYRPVSLIPVVSKLYERNMYNQIQDYIQNYLSPYLFGFRKGHSTEQCLVIMLEEWKKALDKKGSAGAILTDLSKAFDSLNHELLIAKLSAYGFDNESLEFIYSYLKERKQRTKVGSYYSSWKSIKVGVPQGSILGPLLFNIFLNDIFYFITDISIANYADDNTPYTTKNSITSLLETLEVETNTLLDWFRNNEMKPNEDKCHLLVINQENISVNVGKENISCSSSVDLLGIKIDDKLNFNEHVSKLCKKGNQKLHALARISKYMNKDKLRLIMRTFITSQFNYAPLTWMFHSRTLNNKINRLHERALRLVYEDENLTFQELLDLDESMSIHHRNIQKLAIEMFKIKNNLSPPLMQEIFKDNTNIYDFRNKRCWEPTNVRTVHYGTETISYRGPKTWDMVPQNIKDSLSLAEFKSKIKSWKPNDCACRLCKTFIPQLGFID